MLISFEKPLSATQRQALVRRQKRMATAETSIVYAEQKFGQLEHGFRRRSFNGLTVREGFVYRESKPGDVEAGDRSLPPRDQRPPASNLVTPRGSALRFALMVLAVAQIMSSPGRRFHPEIPIRPATGSELGWTDLLASASTGKSDGRVAQKVIDKKVRAVYSALDRMEEFQLLELERPPTPGTKARFDLFEEGTRTGDPVPYLVPKPGQRGTFTLPAGFITNGWIHVLEDTEILLILMLACGRDRLSNEDMIAIPAHVRVHNYGVNRDAFSSHKFLERLGLVAVNEVGRHEDGKAIEYAADGASLHRLALLTDGFNRDGAEVVAHTIRERLRD